MGCSSGSSGIGFPAFPARGRAEGLMKGYPTPHPPGCYPVILTHTVLPRFALLFSLASLASAQPSALLDAMSQELNRNFTVLKQKADPPPYFLSYEITEVEYYSVSGTLGTVNATNGGKTRSLAVS